MDSSLYSIINNLGPSGDCIRFRMLRFFADTTYGEAGATRPLFCCSECHPDFKTPTNKQEALEPPKQTSSSIHTPWFRMKLQEWRATKAMDICRDCRFGVEPLLVMPDIYLEAAARYGLHMHQMSDLTKWVEGWAEVRRYGEEVLAILERGRQAKITNGTEVDTLWRAANAHRKRKSIPEDPSEEGLHNERRDTWAIQKGWKPLSQATRSTGRRGSLKPAIVGKKGPKAAPATVAAGTSIILSSQASSSQGVTNKGSNQQASELNSGLEPISQRIGEDAATALTSQVRQVGAQQGRRREWKGKQPIRQPLKRLDINKAISSQGGGGSSEKAAVSRIIRKLRPTSKLSGNADG